MNPKPYGVNELREMFLSFFESKGHLRLPSFSLIPQNDASLLLINSGMAPMKPYFTGEVGDIITMGVEKPRNHTTVICGVLADEAGQTVDYLLCSNTANLRNYPASAYYYANRQLTRILGWND